MVFTNQSSKKKKAPQHESALCEQTYSLYDLFDLNCVFYLLLSSSVRGDITTYASHDEETMMMSRDIFNWATL